MDEKNGKSCYGCRFHIDSVGEKGYCSLFDHESFEPETVCERFEPKAEKTAEDNNQVIKNRNDDRKLVIVNILTVGSFLASTILTVLGLVFAIYFSTSLFVNESIPVKVKVITFLVLLILAFTGIYVLFTFGKKFLWARFLEMLAAAFAVIVVLVKYETIWTSLNVHIVKFIDVIFAGFIQ